MLFNGWESIIRVLLVGTLAYAAVVLVLRLSGNRTLSKMSAYDFIVTIALGSTLSSILINRNVSLAEGLAAFALLVVLQLAVSWLLIRSRLFGKAVRETPVLLLRDGVLLDAAMKNARITRSDIRSAVRKRGIGALEQVDAVVLETDGTLSVIGQSSAGSRSALEGVRGASGAAGSQGLAD